MKKGDPIIWGIIILMLVLVVGVFLAAKFSEKKSIVQYQTNDQDTPQLSLGETQFDLGQLKLSDTKTQEVPLKNVGSRPLVISDFLTSCNCTFAEVTIGNITSPRFSMHTDNNWTGEIAPGETAIVKLIYVPSVMPVQGKVKRTVVFKTNDPNNPLINLNFTAEVE